MGSLTDQKILVYTVSRSDSTPSIVKAMDCLHEGQSLAGINHDWILWANSPGILQAGKLGWLNGPLWGTGENVGQHVVLTKILEYARENNYTYIVKVDDDLTWMGKNWLKKLVNVEQECFKYSNKHVVIGATVRGLRNPIPVAARIKLGKTKLIVVPIVGGACRLHHISFFDEYVPDCRRAMGAGGDTSIAQHAMKIQVGMFLADCVKVGHNTDKLEEEDPEYYSTHDMFQSLPYVPRWCPNE